MKRVECRKCGGQMKPSKALQNVATGIPDFHGGEAVTFSYGKKAKLIDCMKCEDCGWSVTGKEKGDGKTIFVD